MDRTRKLLLALAAAAVAATLLALRGWIAPATARWVLLALLGWYALQMLPLVTIPWVLPKAVLSVTVFCNLRCRLWRDAIANGTYRSLPRYVPSDK